jgi:hypothetical protein
MRKAGNKTVESKPKKVFKNFAEYWHYIRILSEDQREILANCLSAAERKSLQQSFHRGGWQDLFMRNACDFTLDRLKEQYGIDLLDLRMQLLSGKKRLVQKRFWKYVNECFSRVAFEDIAYIFGGIKIEDYDADYIKLSI